MRQVPFTNYLIIGNSRMAMHFCHYLSLLKLPYQTWSRRHNNDTGSLYQALSTASHIIVLIKDAAIASFTEAWRPSYGDKRWVHFSGQLTLPHLFSCHPLMTFTHQLYDLVTYQSVPFILTDKRVAFSDLLPHIPNQAHTISADLKTFYHALCVISGNFTSLVWQKFFHELINTFQVPHSIAIPYFKQIMHNILTDPQHCLTGPLVRGDQSTIQAHFHALQNDPFLPIYQAILNYFQQKETV